MAEHMRNVDCRYLELDELWTFCGKKERRLSPVQKLNPDLGDQYLFFGIDRETKAWTLGKRTLPTAITFLGRLGGFRPFGGITYHYHRPGGVDTSLTGRY